MPSTKTNVNAKREMDHPTLNVLHVAGSSTADYWFKVSLLYAREAITPSGATAKFALVRPDERYMRFHVYIHNK